MGPNQAIILLWYGSILFLAILWIRLFVTGLFRRYPAFTLYIFSLWAESVLLSLTGAHKGLYARVWVISRMVVLPLELIAVFAIFGQWTASFPGIGKFGRQLLVVLMAIAIGVFLSTTSIGVSGDGWDVASRLITIVNRGANFGCSVFLLFALGFFYRFGGPVASNLKRHSWAMAAYVSSNTISYFILSSHHFLVGNFLLPSVSLAALGFWIVALRKSGEAVPATAMNEEEWEDAERWNEQLQSWADAIALTPQGLKKK